MKTNDKIREEVKKEIMKDTQWCEHSYPVWFEKNLIKAIDLAIQKTRKVTLENFKTMITNLPDEIVTILFIEQEIDKIIKEAEK